jgi:hypothetical protein
MNAILEPFKALWRRKLWPVAVLLVAALVAVPMVLAKQPVAEPAPANAAAGDDGLPATFVAAADPAADGARRRVLGESKDPFTPAELSKRARAARKKAAREKVAAEHPKTTGKSPAKSSPSSSGSHAVPATPVPSFGSGAGAGAVIPTEPPASAAPAPAPTYPLYSIKVRFGRVDDDLATKTVERLKVLPSTEQPVLIYRGVEDGGKVAVFELTGSVVALGDGRCEPRPEDCQILKLKAGETEFLTVSDTGEDTDAQYQIDLVKINAKRTTSKSDLKKASSAGLGLLKALDRKPRYAYDETTGTLHKVSTKRKGAAL